ncbi:hypothetical protein [Paenarthrobacter ureafaciens]|uniref:hypothetical protein n=1 Tax=Paenarthrobacter ureafaciens TaxID=37931 RepID=UPI0019179597|nr:hypothetical protein [Paenarthrobacter ureafaciens]QQQ62123.1 hypothetical protein JHQ56_18105 [Paenarthrobacter ureafaciens]
MAPLLADSRSDKHAASYGSQTPPLDEVRPDSAIRTLTAIVTLAADGWFELSVLQIPGLVVHASRLDRAPEAVRKAACQSTGRARWEFDVHVQW